MRRWRGGWLAGVLVAFVSAGVSPYGLNRPLPLALHVELIEQAACVMGHTHRVMFEVRTVYVNQGRAPVSIAVGTGRIVAASFAPAENTGAGTAGALSFGVPAGLLPSAADETAAGSVVGVGWAVSGRTNVWLPLTTGSDAAHLSPGAYTARFDLTVMASDAGTGAASFEPVRLSTAPLAVTIHTPSQVQECGSFSLPLPPGEAVVAGPTR
jgi:hypothetical protein